MHIYVYIYNRSPLPALLIFSSQQAQDWAELLGLVFRYSSLPQHPLFLSSPPLTRSWGGPPGEECVVMMRAGKTVLQH